MIQATGPIRRLNIVYSLPLQTDKRTFFLGKFGGSGLHMPEFQFLVEQAIERDDLLALVLSKPCRNCAVTSDKLTVRPIELQGVRQYQWAARANGQETHENLTPAETLAQIYELFGRSFAHVHVYTSVGDYTARQSRKGQIKISRAAPSKRPDAGHARHNRSKQYIIPENQPCHFLEAIGVMTASGKVKASHTKKFRQINRYLELVNDTVPNLPAKGPLKVVDFGCGKSYLTFALHHLLTQVHGREVQIVGLDRKSEVIRDCQRIANRLKLPGLEFREGDIGMHRAERIHLAVSLHACDTATDEAIAKAIHWQAEVILAVPCCQHEIARLLPNTLLPGVQQHGILKDRLAAILTDSLRAKALESLGYKSQVLEFIDLEHTAKNVLIRAVRRDLEPAAAEQRNLEYQAFKLELGIAEFHLDRALRTT